VYKLKHFLYLCFVQLTNAEREEMRRYRHSAVMVESKLRVSARQKMLVELQRTVQEINVGILFEKLSHLYGYQFYFGLLFIATLN